MLSIILTDIKEPLAYIPMAFAIALAGTMVLALFDSIRAGSFSLKKRYIPLALFIAYVYTVLVFAFFFTGTRLTEFREPDTGRDVGDDAAVARVCD